MRRRSRSQRPDVEDRSKYFSSALERYRDESKRLLAVLDKDEVVRFWNPAAESLFGAGGTSAAGGSTRPGFAGGAGGFGGASASTSGNVAMDHGSKSMNRQEYTNIRTTDQSREGRELRMAHC